MSLNRNNFKKKSGKKYIFGMSIENHIIKVSFCGKFQKAIKPKRSFSFKLTTLK